MEQCGGVVADTASLSGNWGNSQSGFYASTGYQWIKGKNVEQNTHMDGNVGTYWNVLTNKQGSLTLGLNLFAMHYHKNLRYFTTLRSAKAATSARSSIFCSTPPSAGSGRTTSACNIQFRRASAYSIS